MKNRQDFTLHIKKAGQEVQRYETSSKRRFLNHARTINWKDKQLEVYLRVSYGKQETNVGEETFYNDGYYSDKEQFNMALEAFLDT